MKELEINGIPLPPSDNKLFADAKIEFKGQLIKTKRVKSREYKNWLAIMDGHHWQHKATLRQISELYKGHQLHATITLRLKWETVYTKTNKAKSELQEFDPHNRQKAIMDWVSQALGIDDRWYSSIHIVRMSYHREALNQIETMSINVKPMDPIFINEAPKGTVQ